MLLKLEVEAVIDVECADRWFRNATGRDAAKDGQVGTPNDDMMRLQNPLGVEGEGWECHHKLHMFRGKGALHVSRRN